MLDLSRQPRDLTTRISVGLYVQMTSMYSLLVIPFQDSGYRFLAIR